MLTSVGLKNLGDFWIKNGRENKKSRLKNIFSRRDFFAQQICLFLLSFLSFTLSLHKMQGTLQGYLYNVEKEWTEYPVLFISMASGKHMEKEQLERYLGMRLAEYEERYGITQPAVDNVFYYRW